MRKSSNEINACMVILRALKMGISLTDLDKITLGFLIELIEQNNSEAANEDVIEATSEILARF